MSVLFLSILQLITVPFCFFSKHPIKWCIVNLLCYTIVITYPTFAPTKTVNLTVYRAKEGSPYVVLNSKNIIVDGKYQNGDKVNLTYYGPNTGSLFGVYADRDNVKNVTKSE